MICLAPSYQRTPYNQSDHSGLYRPHQEYPEKDSPQFDLTEITISPLTSISSWVTGSPMNFIISPSSLLSMYPFRS